MAYILKMAARTQLPVGSRSRTLAQIHQTMETAKQQALQVWKGAKRSWVSVESDDGTCLILISTCGYQERTGAGMQFMKMPRIKKYVAPKTVEPAKEVL